MALSIWVLPTEPSEPATPGTVLATVENLEFLNRLIAAFIREHDPMLRSDARWATALILLERSGRIMEEIAGDLCRKDALGVGPA